ncbi:Plasma membrane proteolipid 31 [Cyphellophora attinorum]|uniref:Plasma membrane proteolipid 31 n=1 Tax=Cyphellophora attinorum TaxID=1664694 RepID=A0A0N1H256_9EURO|nr:Plasma membrane proteolipid 31 [Phialophora attinorum]KPI38442.1 Plasma membrane proteolipid 31 [Phialophora attinorum]
MSCGDLFLGLLAIIFPPLAVWVKRGLCSADSLINILLCLLGFIPGLLHAWYIIAKFPEEEHDYERVPDAENQRVTYYYINQQPGPRRDYGTQGGQRQPAPKPNSSAPRVPQHSRPEPAGPSVGAGSDEAGAPPSYSDVVKGDNKVQNQN